MNNPAIHAYILLGPFLLGGALFIKNEWLLATLSTAVAIFLIVFVKYYRPIKNNNTLATIFTIYTATCVLLGMFEHYGVISFNISYAIFVALIIIYFVKYNKLMLSIVNEKSSINE